MDGVVGAPGAAATAAPLAVVPAAGGAPAPDTVPDEGAGDELPPLDGEAASVLVPPPLLGDSGGGVGRLELPPEDGAEPPLLEPVVDAGGGAVDGVDEVDEGASTRNGVVA